MSNKRSGFQYRQPRSKMPKLDITISSSQSVSSRLAGPNPGSSHATNHQHVDAEELWGGDDDEEFILLASQAVEKYEANAEMVISQSMNPNMNLDISYGQFRNEVRSSTQFDDCAMIDEFDNDDIFSNIPDDVCASKPSTSTAATNNDAGNFKMPNAPAAAIPSTSSHDEQKRKTEQAKNEAQQSFLTDMIKTQKKDLDNLRESLKKVTDKCQIKEGETTTLRYELEHKTQQFDKVRKDKMAEIMQLEKQFSVKITDLEKKIESQQTELEFKNIEMMKKSRKSMNESIVTEPDRLADEETLYNLFRSNVKVTDLIEENTITEKASTFLTANCTETYQRLSEKDFEVLSQLNALQSLYNTARIMKNERLDVTGTAQLLMIAANLVEVLCNCADRLDPLSPRKYNPSTQHKIVSNSYHSADVPAEPSEKFVYERQALAVLALFCADYKHIIESLLFEPMNNLQAAPSKQKDAEKYDPKYKKMSFIEALIDVLHKIGTSKSVHLHKGLVESSSILLVAIAKNYTPSTQGDPLIRDLFKSIAYSEPDFQTLGHLSEFLEAISSNERIECCNNLCLPETNSIVNYNRFRINRYSYGTCPLQIYACIVQVVLNPSISPINTTQLELLTKITKRMMLFLRQCFKRPVDWLFRRNNSSNDGDSIASAGTLAAAGTSAATAVTAATAPSRVSLCYCYMVTSTIALLHMCINEWVYDHSRIDAKQMESVFKMATFFLYDNFHKHFEPKVLQIGGFAIKNRLQVVHDWIVAYSNIFSFHDCHEFAIKSVNLRRLPLLNEPQMVTTESKDNEPCPILMKTFDEFFPRT